MRGAACQCCVNAVWWQNDRGECTSRDLDHLLRGDHLSARRGGSSGHFEPRSVFWLTSRAFKAAVLRAYPSFLEPACLAELAGSCLLLV